MVNTTTALSNKLTEIILGGQAAQDRSFVSLVGGGVPLDAEDVQWAKTEPPYVPSDEASAAAAFARMVNRIPNAVGNWAASQSSLETEYATWLNSASAPEFVLTAEQQKELDAAIAYRQENKAAYRKGKSEWERCNTRLQAALRGDRNDPQYVPDLTDARNALDDALDDWEVDGKKREYEKADTVYDLYHRSGFGGALTELKNRFTDWKNLNKTKAGSSFVPVGLYPDDFLDDGHTWSKFTFKSNELTQFTENYETKVNVGANLNALFWSAGGDLEYDNSHEYSDVNTTDVSIEFEFTRVGLDRLAWFDDSLLRSTTWWFQGATKANPTFGTLLSDGAPPPRTTGAWPMVPSEMIVARKLKVTTKNYNLQQSSWAESFKVGVKGGFWVFTTENNVEHSSTKKYKHEFKDEETISAEQTQIIAFVCDLMPKEPNPEPSLLP